MPNARALGVAVSALAAVFVSGCSCEDSEPKRRSRGGETPCTPTASFEDEGGPTDVKEIMLTLSASGCSRIEPFIRTDNERYFAATRTGPGAYRRWVTLQPGNNPLTAVVFTNGHVETEAGSTSYEYTPTTPKSGPSSGFIAGVVRRHEDDQPIAGALVWVRGVAGELETNAQGEFSFPTPDAGQYVVNVATDGYTWAQRKASVQTGRIFRVDDIFLTEQDSTTATITPKRGGKLVNSAGDIELTVPARAVRAPVDVSGVSYSGSRSLPDALPDSSRWTQAFDLQPDGVRFDTPATLRVKNELGFPAGTDVPVGVFNPRRRGVGALDDGHRLRGRRVDRAQCHPLYAVRLQLPHQGRREARRRGSRSERTASKSPPARR